MIALFAALSLSSLPGDGSAKVIDHPQAAVQLEMAIAYFPDRTWEPLELSVLATPEEISTAIPFRPGQFGVVIVRCGELSGDGRLLACSASANPEDVGYADAADSLIPFYRVVAPSERVRAGSPTFIVQLRLSHTDAPARQGPCMPPSCSVTPEPPPPIPDSGTAPSQKSRSR